MKRKRVLLTTAYGPNDLGWGEDMFDLLKSRLARGHGPFAMASHCHYFALYLIAENISHPTTVLENPHWEEFTAELEKGYDVVGIQLKSLHTAKIARMLRYMRENYPNIETVIGGYGVSTLQQPVPGDTNGDAEYIRENAHHLCREEGVCFMRKLLDDKPYDREITQYNLPMTGFTIDQLDKFHARIPIILVSLGCPNACDFCNTSAFFYHKKIYVATPEQVYRFMKNYQKRLKSDDIFVLLFDEDFFLNQEFVRELGRLLQSDKKTWGVKWFSFGSTRSLSQYTVEELRSYGLGAVWIGVESFLSDAGTTEDTYAKRRGQDIQKLFEELHRYGIQTVGSLVLGFDFHTPENLKEDIDKFVALKPFFYQLSPLTPCPGTALYDRMLEEGRILDTYKWSDFHLWKDDVFKLKNFQKGDIKKFFDYAHEKLRDEVGPPLLQMLESMINAYTTLKDKPDEVSRYHADNSKRIATAMYTYLRAVKLYHPSIKVRERAVELERKYKKEIGNPSILTWPISRFIANRVKRSTESAPKEVISDPEPRWTYYHMNGPDDNTILVKKGRKQKTKPYSDRRFISAAGGAGLLPFPII